MNDKKIQVSTEKLEKLLIYLKENTNVIGGIIDSKSHVEFLENLLSESSVNYSIRDQVKIAILRVKGRNNPKPEKLPDDTEISDLELSDIQYMCLVDYLNEIVQRTNPLARIYLSEVQNFSDVKECVEAVEKKSKP